jgi:hypothetical protein
MTTKNTFTLTVRKEDLLDMYGQQIEFKLFSREYVGRVIATIVCLLLGGITLGGSLYDSQYVFYFIVFAGGLGYCVYDLCSAYLAKNKKRASVEEWITEAEQFQTNILSINEQAVVYTRDQEIYTYPFATINVQEFEKHIQILTIDTFDSILLPKKAFADDEFHAFMQLITERMKDMLPEKNSRKWFTNTSFTALEITKFKSISSKDIEKSITIRDSKSIQSLVQGILQIPVNGDMMISFGPAAEHIELIFKNGTEKEVVEVYQKKFKTPSTGFHSSNDLEKGLYEKIDNLLSNAGH